MQKASIEPGFLQVFKVYAWLRVIFSFFSLRLLNPDFARHFSWADDFAVPVIFIFLHTLLLLLILYWHKVQDLFGLWYVPFLLSLATMGLMIEQQLFSAQSFFWQLHPFLYILLILVAWQYRFLQVVVYTVLTVFVNVIFLWIWPAPDSLTMFSQGTEWMFTYGLLFFAFSFFLASRICGHPSGGGATPTKAGFSAGEPKIGQPCRNGGAAYF